MFKANGLYEIVKGESKLESMKSEEEKETWKKKDAKAQQIITTTIDRKILLHILNCETSCEMYSKLSE
ncbi:hypothetical protein QE152_g15584 [Popillia japonica]|uniref:Uncharacterized protein n=1 Tax=Popillia japonica TaxID=7064 RepID=A0AAW1L7Z7_POPJA